MFQQWIGVGNMTKDCEARQSKNNNTIAMFTLACDSGFGEYKHTEFMRCVCLLPKLAEIIANYGQKGKKYMVKGVIKTNKYQDAQGADRYSTECHVDEFKMLGSRSDNQQSNQNNGWHGNQAQEGNGSPTGFETDVPF